jgi:hypothetical protein
MKQIQPLTLWVNGQQKVATEFYLTIIYDNLLNSATFYWTLNDENTTKLADGNLTMGQPTYDQWGTQSDVNEWAYEWAATELNLTLA